MDDDCIFRIFHNIDFPADIFYECTPTLQGVPLYANHLPKCVGEKVRAAYKLMMMPTSLLPFHSHQARFRVYLYGAPSPVKIVCWGPEIIVAP